MELWLEPGAEVTQESFYTHPQHKGKVSISMWSCGTARFFICILNAYVCVFMVHPHAFASSRLQPIRVPIYPVWLHYHSLFFVASGGVRPGCGEPRLNSLSNSSLNAHNPGAADPLLRLQVS